MKKSDILQKKIHDEDFDYRMAMEIQNDYLNDHLKFYDRINYRNDEQRYQYSEKIIGAVNWNMQENSYYMDMNGIDKFVIMLASMLFLIEHKVTYLDIAYGVKWDILDFETGNYDDLFSPEDLHLIKKDIKKINDYLEEHPELIEGLEEDRRKTQSE